MVNLFVLGVELGSPIEDFNVSYRLVHFTVAADAETAKLVTSKQTAMKNAEIFLTLDKTISLLQILHNSVEVIIMQYKNLRGIREDRDIKQKEIAAILNVSQNTYSQYETGVISLTAEVLVKLADYYGVSIDYLLDRTNNPKMQK